MALLEAQNLEKNYADGTRALRGASFSIEKGEFVAIIGPSGSGKSTLLHILGFLDHESSGVYRYDGKRADDFEDKEIAVVRNEKFGFIFQAFNLLGKMSVYENVRLPLLYSGTPEAEWDEKIRKAIRSVGLEERTDHDAAKLSGGEKQRVAIARALVNNPQVIFADEPTGNLDSASGGAVMKIIAGLHEAGHTIILITHETYTAEYADRIIKIKDGLVESDEKVLHKNTARDNFQK